MGSDQYQCWVKLPPAASSILLATIFSKYAIHEIFTRVLQYIFLCNISLMRHEQDARAS